MKRLIKLIGLSLVVAWGTVCSAPSAYRIAGTIASGDTYLIAIVETPDGQQHLVRKGETIGEVEVLDIGAQRVLLKFRNGERWLELASGDASPVSSDSAGSGISAVEFKQRVYQSFRPARLATIEGMEEVLRLSPSARILSISDLDHSPEQAPPMGDLDAAMERLEGAISEGKMVRITLTGNGPIDTIYLQAEAR